jgi:Fe-S cluster assembly iron-binding protein IscA
MLNPKGDKTLSKDAVVVYEISDKAAEKGENVIRWNNQLNEGYRLFVKNGTAKKGERYESTIIYSLDDKPKAKAVGDK